MKKIGLLKDLEKHPLAGKMLAVLDVCTRLPVQVWYEANPLAHDQTFWSQIRSILQRGTLLIVDLGFTNFEQFIQLKEQGVTLVTRAKTNLRYEVEVVLQRTATVHDQVVWIGQDDTRQKIRLIEVVYHGKWYRYLTTELDPNILPVAYAVALYWQRWRIEDAFNVIKRLLGLAYFWSGSQNAVELQLWTTWLLYAALIDLTDELAEALHRPFSAVSIEMVYRSLYFFTKAHERGEAQELVPYLVENAKLFGILKRKSPESKFHALLRLTTADKP